MPDDAADRRERSMEEMQKLWNLPTVYRTGLFHGQVYPAEARHEFPRANPMKRPGTPADVAEACIYLSAPSGRFITGEVLTIDGGGRLWGELWTAGRPDYFAQQ